MDERNRLLARNFSSAAPSAVKTDNLGDAATEETQRTRAFVEAGATQARVFEVLDAIRRIECGRYGICEVTGEPIEEARLRAIPWARFSLRGQKEMEAGGWGRRRAMAPLQSSVQAESSAAPESEELERERAA